MSDWIDNMLNPHMSKKNKPHPFAGSVEGDWIDNMLANTQVKHSVYPYVDTSGKAPTDKENSILDKLTNSPRLKPGDCAIFNRCNFS